MRINWKIIGSVALVGVLAYFVYDSNRAGVIASTAKQAITTQELKVVVEKPEPLQLDAEVTTVGAEVELVEINYLSVEEAFEATEQQALELLEDYKFYLSQDTAESHFGIFGIKSSCMGLSFYTQQDLDSWIAEDKWSRGREAMEFEAITLMERVARCREVLAFIGDEEMSDTDKTAKSLMKSAEMGHPIGKLIVHKNTDDFRELTSLFTNAYNYSKKFPQYKSDIYGMAAFRFNDRSSATFQALFFMANRDGFIFNEVVDPNEVVDALQESLEERFLPLKIDELHQKRKEISEAMENGDWSWLLSES
jgi:hypothetical protein